MGRLHTPAFDEWVDYCFTAGCSDFSGDWNDPVVASRIERFVDQIDPGCVLGHLTALFEDPSFVAETYNDDEIRDGTWFIFGQGSCYLPAALYRSGASVGARARCVRFVATMYSELFDRVCGLRGADPDAELIDDGVDSAVFMI